MEDLQSKLAALWADLLKSGTPDGAADFFECGGTSLTAVHLAALIQEQFQVSVDAVEVVTGRTLAVISGLVAERLAAVS
ncbi:acyl carrier protein [Kitasatospora sp. MAP5-34]|uniref:acyl carrier protein n=1 Tax=Kitasatospora sp. MAP5-34 TaxID=3035102 RepID=UPI0024757D69|nr:acyl carrier protein [Kitasatospora sp. MAP5-34]MDH6578573.1 acyl carrier protein [Kitasatospora sp. MAP5-34]